MLRNEGNPQKVEIPLYVGTELDYGIQFLRAALGNKLGRKSLGNYRFIPDGNGTVKLTGEGPYSKGELVSAIKQAMLEEIKKRGSKYHSVVNSPLHIKHS